MGQKGEKREGVQTGQVRTLFVLVCQSKNFEIFRSMIFFMPTGRLAVGRDAPAQANSQGIH
jgi:hypothetical protein